MLHLIPAPLHRAALRVANGLRRRWWRVRRPHLGGVRIVALDEAGRVLLVRHTYGTRKWLLPGGGVKRGEQPLAAGLRELAEETDCALDHARVFLTTEEPLYGATNRVSFVCGRIVGTPRADGREIAECRMAAPDALPADMPRGFADGLPGWLTAAAAALPPR